VAFLERHFGEKLVERGRGRFSLTEHGEALLEGSRKILAAYQEGVDRIHHPGEISGTVSVQTVHSIGLYDLALFVKSFLRRYPRVNLHVEYHQSDTIYSRVSQGVCDLGIVAYPRPHPLTRIVPFKKEKLTLVCSPDDPLAVRKRVSLKVLNGKNFVAFNRNIPTGKVIDDILRKAKVFVNVVHEFDNIETLKRSVEVGAGVSILPENTVSQEVTNKTLVCLQLSEGPFYRPTGIVLRKGRNLPRAVQEFVRWLS
jgi:DNA-binding transcriptional LysR family regulator